MEIVTADIGGTHARFAIATVESGRVVALSEPVNMATSEHASLQIAWQAFGAGLARPLPRAAAIAIAAPVRGDVIKLTNNPWIVRPALIPDKLGVDTHILINDFEAIAHAVGAVDPANFSRVAGPDIPLPDAGVISIIGPGTGLGVAALLRTPRAAHVIATEGGHSDFAPLDSIDDRILAHLRAKHTRVSVERVVAGPGLRAIWEVLAAMEGRDVPHGDDKALWTRALTGADSIAAAALDRFCLALGSVAGDIALTHGPGAVVLAGGLGQRLAKHLPNSGFAQRFVSKGRYRSLMEAVPVKLIKHPEPGLFGAAVAYAQEFVE
ncbi:Glucokinase [Enhygromyxa salina]|uniref:Glucokinase n=1 Tax=Enhygromyxa salina TaxID=215803 RepID=A0A0C1ZSC7_9BACT|nr:glucokinase [Enhygromyxa salina]KIG13983.1 Glucokinase [Enhygromyxa salina]